MQIVKVLQTSIIIIVGYSAYSGLKVARNFKPQYQNNFHLSLQVYDYGHNQFDVFYRKDYQNLLQGTIDANDVAPVPYLIRISF